MSTPYLLQQTTLWALVPIFIFMAGCKQGQDPTQIEMINVEGGIFMMGCNEGYNDERPLHQDTVQSFFIGKYEVTQAQWQAIMDSGSSVKLTCPDCPKDSVNWDDVQTYIEKLNVRTGKTYRLPTETEWEYAARGGKLSKGYEYCGSNSYDSVAWFIENSLKTTHPIGQKKPNELELYDMSGNVWEWCSDWYKSHPGNMDPFDYTGTSRVCRGGSWTSFATDFRMSYRYILSPGDRLNFVGFRLASSIK